MNVVTIGVIIGLCEAAKQVGLPSRFVPLLSLLLGVGSIFVVGEGTVLDGLVMGLTAVGLYSGSRATVGQ